MAANGYKIWLRHETKAKEQRVTLTPDGCKQLLAAGYQVTVERSPTRIIPDADYQAIEGVVMADSKYFTDDFWHKPGYLGANPPASLLKARIQEVSRIKAGIPIDQAVALGLVEPISEEARGTADLAWKSLGGKEGKLPAAFCI